VGAEGLRNLGRGRVTGWEGRQRFSDTLRSYKEHNAAERVSEWDSDTQSYKIPV
jgi:hypothetical protein